MKKFLVFPLLFSLAALFSQAAMQPSPCLNIQNYVPLTGNDAYIENGCFAGLQRQIVRNYNVDNLTQWNTQLWQSEICIAPYESASYLFYCPAKYCNTILAGADLKASMFSRAAGLWGMHHTMGREGAFHRNIKQMVYDINAVYDVRGMRRPVIQGSIFENFDPDADMFVIPQDVINAFIGEMTPSEYSYYVANARDGVKFSLSKVSFGSTETTFQNSPDINKIEARMWFYYLAKMYIDAGIKSIHMGQMGVWGRNDVNNGTGYQKTIALTDKIRAYAASKNSFVLLTEENLKSFKRPGTNTFLFDFDIRGMWPSEIASNGDVYVALPCSIPTNNYWGTAFPNEPFKAVVSQCVIDNELGGPGISPLNGCFLPTMPKNTYWDLGPGNNTVDWGGVPRTLGEPTTSPGNSCFGYDDTKWFARKLTSSSVRAFWMSQTIKEMRKFGNGFAYMTAPGILPVPMVNSEASAGTAGAFPGSYLLCDEPDVKSSIMTQWEPQNNAVIRAVRGYGELVRPRAWCTSLVAQRHLKYTIDIANPDNTTIYTWHIIKPDGSWLPFQYGNLITLTPEQIGTYQVFLRQDNLAGYTSASNQVVKSAAYNLNVTNLYNCNAQGGGMVKSIEEEEEEEIELTASNDFTAYNSYLADIEFRNRGESNLVIPIGKESVGVGDIDDDYLDVLPNPTQASISYIMKSNEFSSVSFEVFDMLGNVVCSGGHEANSTHKEIDLSSVVAGIYVVKFKIDGFSVIKKITKI